MTVQGPRNNNRTECHTGGQAEGPRLPPPPPFGNGKPWPGRMGFGLWDVLVRCCVLHRLHHVTKCPSS